VTLRIAGALLFVAVLVGGCDSKAPKATTSEPPAPAGNLREEAATLAARGDYIAAERKYREALEAQPDDVDLHFGLGSVLSQLDRREEAAEELRWVVAHGRAGRPEVDSARRWLAETGATGTAATTSSSEPTVDATSMGTVAGKLTWPGLPAEKEFGIRIVVASEGEGNVRRFARTKLNGTFSVGDLPEGTYKLTGLAGPVRIWSDLPVTVTAGRQTTVDLSPANAVVSATDFPARIR
jgi:hypothetical protein